MYHHRVENYYKSDILLNEEEIFDESTSSLNVPRFITQGSMKSWKNTISLLEYLAQFAVAGNMGTWMTEEGKILEQRFVEPKSDKMAVQAFLKGRDLMDQQGKEVEAKEALNRAISKFKRHAQAYERRGFINYRLKNYEDAIYDFTKSIDISSNNPEPYYGRGQIRIIQKDLKGAIADFDQTIKKSIPLQPIYWNARRLKAQCHLKMDDYEGALSDLKFYSARRFRTDDPNYLWQRYTNFYYGIALIKKGEPEKAIEAFNKALGIEAGKDKVSDGEIHMYRGDARKAGGKTGFLKDWHEALSQGVKEAKSRIDNR
jgi:tetratricopeptide (TPR) repeat protein